MEVVVARASSCSPVVASKIFPIPSPTRQFSNSILSNTEHHGFRGASSLNLNLGVYYPNQSQPPPPLLHGQSSSLSTNHPGLPPLPVINPVIFLNELEDLCTARGLLNYSSTSHQTRGKEMSRLQSPAASP